MSNKLAFKRVLIISAKSSHCQTLAGALQKHLQSPKFTFLDPVLDSLPDNQFDWLDIDLMMIDLSGHTRTIYQWYAKDSIGDSMPPAIFLAHPASYTDAGSFYRAGASNYLELHGLRSKQIRRALSIAERSINKKHEAQPPIKQPDNTDVSANPFSLNIDKMAEEVHPSQEAHSSTDIESSNEIETRPEFVNTGVMNILDREELRKRAEKKLANQSDS
jgi:hypothetical protein